MTIELPAEALDAALERIESGKPCHCPQEDKDLRALILAGIARTQNDPADRLLSTPASPHGDSGTQGPSWSEIGSQGISGPRPAILERHSRSVEGRTSGHHHALNEATQSMQPTNRSEAAFKAAETRRIKRAEQQAKYKREHYEIWDCEDFQGSYLADKNTINEILEICCEMVTSDEFACPGVVVWLDGQLIAAAKRGDQGEVIVTDFTGPYPDWQRRLPN